MIAVLMPCMSSLGKAKAPVRPLPKDAMSSYNIILCRLEKQQDGAGKKTCESQKKWTLLNSAPILNL